MTSLNTRAKVLEKAFGLPYQKSVGLKNCVLPKRGAKNKDSGCNPSIAG